jgi:hypothetical protein
LIVSIGSEFNNKYSVYLSNEYSGFERSFKVVASSLSKRNPKANLLVDINSEINPVCGGHSLNFSAGGATPSNALADKKILTLSVAWTGTHSKEVYFSRGSGLCRVER